MPRPYRRRLGTAVALNDTCVSCHPDEAAEWRASRHRQANTNAAYQAAFAIEPVPFCQGCHAPESEPDETPPRAVSEMGVGCVTCHVTEEGTVLAAASSRAEPDHGPHPVRRSAAFARTGGCAGCHEFAFPAAHGDDLDQLMQATVAEHRRSPAAAKACAACHMPRREGRRSHAFAEVREAGWLKSNLQVTAERVADRRIRITLVQPAPGHAYPTGDLFRRLEVGAERRDVRGLPIQREVRHLARHFEIVPGEAGRRLVRDDRVAAEPVAVELDLGAGQAFEHVRWWVSYQRVATVGTGANPADAKIESEVNLHAGELPWGP